MLLLKNTKQTLFVCKQSVIEHGGQYILTLFYSNEFIVRHKTILQ